MSIPLKENCLDLEAIKFFSDVKQQISKIAKFHQLKKNVSRAQAKVQQMKSPQTQQLDHMLIINILYDCLRSFNYNLTIPVLMRESNIISEEVVGKKKLAELLGLKEQFDIEQRLNVSVIQLLVKKMSKFNEKRAKTQDTAIQVQLINRINISNNQVLIENRVKQAISEVEDRERKHYQKQLQLIRERQLIEMKNQVSLQMQAKYKKETEKLNKRFEQLIEKTRKNQQPFKFKEENERLATRNFELASELSKVKQKLLDLQRQNKKHNCLKNEEYVQLSQLLKKERLQIQQKKRQLDYAIRNINTKIEDLVQKKKNIQGNKQSDQFLSEVKINKANKDYMIESIYSQMKVMDQRVKVLSKDNQKASIQNSQLRNKVKDLQKLIKELQSQAIMDENQNEFEAETKHIPTRDIGIKYDQSVEKINKNRKIGKKQRFEKGQVKNVAISVGQEDFVDMRQFQKKEDQLSNDQSSDGEQEFQEQKLEHNKRIMQLRGQMNIIKKKILLLVDSEN